MMNLLTKLTVRYTTFIFTYQKLFLKFFILSLILTCSLFIIETLSYPGIIQNYTPIPSNFFIYLVIILAIPLIHPKSSFILPNKLVVTLIAIILLEIGIYQFLKSVEIAYYPNYIYNKLGIDLNTMRLITIPAIITLIVHSINIYFRFEKKLRKNYDNTALSLFRTRVTIFLVIIILFIYHLTIIFSYNLTTRLVYMVMNPNANYGQKIGEQLSPDFYKFIVFVKTNTKEDDSILIPPQISPWFAYGNRGYMRYFLHPRPLINGNILAESQPAAKYSLVIKSTTQPKQTDWPPFDIKAKKIIKLTADNKTQIETLPNGIFSVTNTPMTSPFALLEL